MGLCERFHCLPSQLLAEDAGLLRLLEIRRRGGSDRPPEVSPGVPDDSGGGR